MIERVVFDSPNHVRDISRSRTFRGTLRRILETTHPRCDHPTCHIPAKNCQADHITPWSHGGTTSQTNGRMACGFHNRLWYRHPHLQPPPPQLTLAPPNTEPPNTAPPEASPPEASPPRLDPPDSLGRDPAHHPPGDAPLTSATRPAAHPGGRPRPRPPDLIVNTRNARLAVTINT